MFERFTDRARSVVVHAQEEARLLNHNYIGTEHLLLGLIRAHEGVAAQALTRLGISLEGVRQRVEDIIGRGGATPTGHVPFTPRAKKVLELSLREALQLGHNYIGTEHILLGLIREGEGVAARVLDRMGADVKMVRNEVIVLLSGGDPPTPPGVRATYTQTPATSRVLMEAHRLAGNAPVATDDVLRAIVADANSVGAKALAAFGVTTESLEQRLAALDRAGTSDELPQEAGARQTTIEIIGDRVAVTIESAELRERLAQVLRGQPLRSGDPGSAGYPSLWEDVHRHLATILQRLEGSSTERWRPPELEAEWEVAAYAVMQRPGGANSFFEVSENVDAAEVKAGIVDWLTAHQPANASDVSYLVILVGGAEGGSRSYRLSWGAVADAPRTELQYLVAHALVDLASDPGTEAAGSAS